MSLQSTAWAGPTLEEFRRETRLHRMRVIEYSLLALEQFSNHFPQLSQLESSQRMFLVESYLFLHDLPKMMTVEQLRPFGYDRERNILQDLHAYYGTNQRPEIVEVLNKIENVIKARVMDKKFAEMPLSIQKQRGSIMAELELLEKAADVADTKNYRDIELAFKKEPGAAARFFNERGEVVTAKIADWIEKKELQDPHQLQCRRLLKIQGKLPR